jgi:hypothetical protein
MSKAAQPLAIEIAKAHWAPLPEWVRRLAEYCDKHTQMAAGGRIRYSASLVNQVLRNKYQGNMDTVKSRVETAFNDVSVKCPILGPITGSECLLHQGASYNPGNHVAVALFRQCRRCPHKCGGKNG